MSRRLLAALATALTILALPALAQAELTTLNTDLTTGADSDRFVNPGDAVAVTATGDPTLTLEYRFIVQYDNAGTWEQVAASAWGSTNTYSFDPATDTGGPFAAGNYRLVTLVREAGNPGDFLANYQRFSYGPVSQTLCEYLDGKTFTNAMPAGVTLNLGDLSTAGVLTVLGSPGIPFSLASSAHGLSTLSFSGDASGGTVTVMPVSESAPVNMNRIQMRVCTLICMDVDATMDFTGSPLTGTYTCSGNTLSIDASGAGSLGGSGILSGLISDAYLDVTGSVTGDTGAGTLTAGDGAVFTVNPPASAPNDPAANLEDDSGGALGMLSLLALLGLARRRRH